LPLAVASLITWLEDGSQKWSQSLSFPNLLNLLTHYWQKSGFTLLFIRLSAIMPVTLFYLVTWLEDNSLGKLSVNDG
jgi:hypothetical protein